MHVKSPASMLPLLLLILPHTFSSFVSAYPRHAKYARDYATVWSVTDYTPSCSPGGCEYEFNITAPALNGSCTASAFTTACSGPISEDEENYIPDSINCTDSSVIWKLDILETYDEIYVSHVWTANGTDGTSCSYNVTGTQALSKEQTGDFNIVDFTLTSTC